MSRFRHDCHACKTRVGFFAAHRWQRRAYCSLRCLESYRSAILKAGHDAADRSPTVCRCEGPPRPLEPQGPHCADCRRMFSAGVREMLRSKPRGSLGTRMRTLLYRDLRVLVHR